MILFWYGENQFAITQQLAGLKQKYIEKTGSEGDLHNLNMNDHEVSELLNALRVVPMFVTSRLVVVRDLSAKKPDQKVIDEIIKSTPESTNLVLIESNPDKRSVFFKSFSKQPGAKEFKNLGRPQLLAWVQNEAKKVDGSISSADASYLLDLCGSDQWRLHNELQKLLAFSPKIIKKTIDELVVPSVEYSSFALVDSLVKKDLPRTLKLYDQLVTQGEADQMILGAVMYQYRVFLAILAGGDAAKSLSISSYALQKSQKTAQDLGVDGLKQAYNLLAKADLAIKTGQLSSGEAMKQLFEQLCV